MEYLKDNDLTPELCRALRQFQGNLREEMSVSQASMQSLRQCLHMLLWLDEWEPLDPGRCWSECVRRDFRALIGDRQLKWRRLLKHLRGNAPVRMPAGWARQAETLLDAVGLDDFREHIELWFAPFRTGEPLPLSVAGSHVLKGLIWYCAVTRDDGLKDCCLWLMDAKWKQKRTTEKALVALTQFGITKEDLRARNLIKPEPPSPSTRLIERMSQAACLHSDNHIRMDPEGELIIIQGQLHFYRLLARTGRIERATDNTVLELNWAAIPDQLRVVLHRECDSKQQLELRVRLLMYDSVFGQYFTVK
jgi:hypothetical protein